jgi:hypothetical protein
MNAPVILIEVVLVLGGTLCFAWWQLRSIKRDQEAASAERRRQAEAPPVPHGAVGADDDQA